jgi:hypothetical protein
MLADSTSSSHHLDLAATSYAGEFSLTPSTPKTTILKTDTRSSTLANVRWTGGDGSLELGVIPRTAQHETVAQYRLLRLHSKSCHSRSSRRYGWSSWPRCDFRLWRWRDRSWFYHRRDCVLYITLCGRQFTDLGQRAGSLAEGLDVGGAGRPVADPSHPCSYCSNRISDRGGYFAFPTPTSAKIKLKPPVHMHKADTSLALHCRTVFPNSCTHIPTGGILAARPKFRERLFTPGLPPACAPASR